MNVSIIKCASVSRAMAAILLFSSANAMAYSWSEIVIPSIGSVVAGGINDRGQVIVTNADFSKAGVYRNGIYSPLPALPAGYRFGYVLGINNGGIVAGGAYSPVDPTHEQGFILVGSRYRFFSQPGWNNTEARAISNSGIVTGYSYTDDQSQTAGFIYNPATGSFTDATPLGSGAGFSATQGMNSAGLISGDGRSAEFGRYAFVWQQGTLDKDGRTLEPFLARVKIDNSGSAARGINDAGVIVGFTGSGLGFVGNDARGYERLVPPGGDAAGAGVICEGINNLRQVICAVTDVDGNSIGEFIGTPDK